MKKTLITILIILIIGLGGWLVVSQGQNNNQPTSINQENSEKYAGLGFEYEDYAGNKVSLAGLNNLPLIVNSWASWCPFCKRELPDLVTIQQEFGEQVKVVAINRVESLGTTKGYTDEKNISDDLTYLLDSKDSFYKSIGGFSMPETIFINTQGQIVFHKRGVMSLDEIRERTQDLINSE